jgi:hypothetical protein
MPTTSACAWPGRCALLWLFHSVSFCSTRIKLLGTHDPALAHRRETDRKIRIIDAHPNAVAPTTSAAPPGMNSPICSASLRYYPLAMLHSLVEYGRLKASKLPAIIENNSGTCIRIVMADLGMARNARSDWHFSTHPYTMHAGTPALLLAVLRHSNEVSVEFDSGSDGPYERRNESYLSALGRSRAIITVYRT